MIEKYYEVRCDYCGRIIMRYPKKKPTKEDIEAIGGVCTPTKQFCSEICLGEWRHDKQQQQYLNIHPDGRIHRN